MLAGAYYYNTVVMKSNSGTRPTSGTKEDAKKSTTKPKPIPPLTPAEEESNKNALFLCNNRGIKTGSCVLNPNTGRGAVLQCHEPFFGKSCSQRCPPSGGKSLSKYGAGFESGTNIPNLNEATCECPTQYKGKNRDPLQGCLKNESGGACVDGYYGEMCDKKGVDIPHAGYCTSKDAGATFDNATGKCVCSSNNAWLGDRCDVPWTSKWTDVTNNAIVFAGGGGAWGGKEGCGQGHGMPSCFSKVPVCDLLKMKTSDKHGCASFKDLCDANVVKTKDGMCSLYQYDWGKKDSNVALWSAIYTQPGVSFGLRKGGSCTSGSIDKRADATRCVNASDEGCKYNASGIRRPNVYGGSEA